jgi:bromodomain-containing protein 8
VPATRKTRRQRRILESEAQSPMVTEGDNLDADEIKVSTPEEYQASSPVPAESTGLRRRTFLFYCYEH